MISCQQKKEKMEKNIFDWEEGICSPSGFPMQVYQGGLTSEDGTFVGLDNGIMDGPWGGPGSGMSRGKKPLPTLLHVTWLSYAERCFYEVDVELDHDKIVKLFQEGYLTKMGALGIQRKTYDVITTGFAPGGVAVVWISGTGKETEVGRYQGKKITIPQSEVNKLDSDRAYMFKSIHWQEVVETSRENLNGNEELNPDHKNLKKQLDEKPIPYGLWDTYRIKYNWKPVFVLQEGAVLDKDDDVLFEYFNGEFEHIFNKEFPLKEYSKKALPKGLAFSWKTKDNIEYAGSCSLSEESAWSVFKEVYGEHPEHVTADLEIRVNIPNTYFTVKLKRNGKETFIKTEGLEVFKVKE